MEKDNKMIKLNTEERKSIRKCFRNNIFSFVPYEIWRDLIVSYSNIQTIILLLQTCRGFNKLVDDDIGKTNLNLALLLRRESQIHLALKYLQKCAHNNNALAMFHLGYAYLYSGWGLMEDDNKAADWFEMSAKCGNPRGMAYFGFCLRNGYGLQKNFELSEFWLQKAFISNDSFVKGFYLSIGIRTQENHKKAFSFFEISAKEGDEIGQYWFALYFENGYVGERNYKKSFYWYKKSAKQGFHSSQMALALIYRYDIYGKQNEKKELIWERKSDIQSGEKRFC